MPEGLGFISKAKADQTYVAQPAEDDAGYGTPTGTLSRGTFDSGTVTLDGLAQRVAALITDLQTVSALNTLPLPDAPTLLTPANGASTSDTTPTFDWSDVSGATGYDIQIASDSGFNTIVQSSTNVASSTYTATTLASTTYYWRVRTRDAGGVGSWASAFTVIIQEPVPNAPTITAPTSGATLTDTTPDITWNAVSGAVTYEVQIATDSGFSSLVSLTGATGIAGTSYTVAPALSLVYTPYYIRARAVNGGGNSAWSSTVIIYIADTTLLTFWLNPESGLYSDSPAVTPATTDGALVRIAQDQSGNSNHATAASDAARFTLKTGANGINNRPVLRSDGVNSVFTTTSFLSSAYDTAFSALFVVKGSPATDVLKVFASHNATALYFGRDLYDAYFRLRNATQKIGFSTAPDNRLWIVIVSFDGTTVRVMMNGNYKSATSVGNMTLNGALTIGDYSAGGFKHTWDIAEMNIWRKSMTLAQMQTLAAYAATRYNAALCTNRYVFEGDSLTEGYAAGASAGMAYPDQLLALYNDPGIYQFMVAVGGATLNQIMTQAARQVDTVPGTDVIPRLMIWAGTNDLKGGAWDGPTLYSNYVSYCTARRAAGSKVVAFTVLPRSDVGTVGGFEAARQSFNTSVRANWATFADALADVAADTRIGDAGDELNTTYYHLTDRVHLNNAGYAVVAPIVKAAIDSIP